MEKLLKLLTLYLDKKSIELIKKFINISIIVCSFSFILILRFYTYFTPIIILNCGILILRTGIMIGISPIIFAIIIDTHKTNQ